MQNAVTIKTFIWFNTYPEICDTDILNLFNCTRSVLKPICSVEVLCNKAERPHWDHLTKFKKPALSVRVEEGVRQVIPVVLWDLEGLIFNAVVEILE